MFVMENAGTFQKNDQNASKRNVSFKNVRSILTHLASTIVQFLSALPKSSLMPYLVRYDWRDQPATQWGLDALRKAYCAAIREPLESLCQEN